MARVPIEIKRLYVRILAKKVAEGSVPSMSDALMALAQTQFDRVSTGEIMVSTSADGFSGSFALPNPVGMAGMTVVGATELVSELLDLYDKHSAFLVQCATYGLVAATIDVNGWPSPLPAAVDPVPDVSEQEIAARMLQFLVPAVSHGYDFRLLQMQGGIQG